MSVKLPLRLTDRYFLPSVASAGDLDGDGRPELLIRAPGTDENTAAMWCLRLISQPATKPMAFVTAPSICKMSRLNSAPGKSRAERAPSPVNGCPVWATSTPMALLNSTWVLTAHSEEASSFLPRACPPLTRWWHRRRRASAQLAEFPTGFLEGRGPQMEGGSNDTRGGFAGRSYAGSRVGQPGRGRGDSPGAVHVYSASDFTAIKSVCGAIMMYCDQGLGI